MRGHPRWLQLGIGSGLIGLALVSVSILSLIVFGPANRDASAIVAALIPAPDPDRHGPPLWSIAAIALLPVTLIAGCEAGAGMLPG